MRINRVALSFFAVGFVAGTFEQAAGLGDAQRGQRASVVAASTSRAPASEPAAAPAAAPSASQLLAPPAIVSERETLPPPLTAERPLLAMGDGRAAEAVAAAFTRVAAVDEAGRPEGAGPSPKLRPFFAPPEEESLVVPEPKVAKRPREFILPIGHGRVTSMFHQGRYHPAIDLAAPLGTPVRATTRKQKVTFAGPRGGYGNLVVARDPSGREHYYGHLQRIVAGIGTLLEQGDLLGLLGSTGHSTGPHVHYEVRTGGRHLNPAGLLFPDFNVHRGYAWNDTGRATTVAARSDGVNAPPSKARVAKTRRSRTRVAQRPRPRLAARYVTQRTVRYTARYAARSGQPRPR